MGSYSRKRYATESASFPKSASSAPGSYSYENFADLPATGSTPGNTAFVVATNKLYIWSGVGWYLIATVTNASPTAISGVNGSYTLAIDGTATTITAVSTDPEGFPLTWSYAVSSGSLGSTATVAQADNVFTITPSTNTANGGTFSLTFSVTDGTTGVVSSVSAFTLSFSVTNSRYTALLVKATNTGSNQTFDDASTSNHTITVRGNTTASAFSPYRHGGYSLSLDGENDYFQVPQTTDLDLTGDFTVECWAYFNDTAGGSGLMGKWSGTGLFGWTLYATASDFWFYTGNSGTAATQGAFTFGVPAVNQWYHLAISRTGSTISTYVNGTRTTTITDSNNCTANTELTIGSDGSALSAWSLNGYMRDVRIVNGTGLYTGTSFAVPTEPLTAVTNTKFLLGDLPYFKDQSTSNNTINVYKIYNASLNRASLEPKSLFDNSGYSGAYNGVSAYFDGVGPDGLDLPASSDFLLDGEFTIDFWFNADVLSADWYERTIFKIGNGSGSGTSTWIYMTIYGSTETGKICFTHSTAQTDATNGVRSGDNAISAGTWNHVAITRDSGNTLKMWLNGALTETKTNITVSYGSSSIGPSFGYDTLTQGKYKGYVSDFRIIKGTCLYTVNFTPPTAPLTAVTNTKFLLNPETSISDLSQQHALTCYGNVATDATTVKFAGTKSIAFNGTGDYLIFSNGTPSTTDLTLDKEFTIEFWAYLNATNSTIIFYSCGGGTANWSATTGNESSFFIYSNRLYHQSSQGGSFHTDYISIPSVVQTGQWQHWAVTCAANADCKWYLNGTLMWSYAHVFPTKKTGPIWRAVIGAGQYLTDDNLDGYIQDFRITKGLVRYTSNFTPPTELQG